MTIFYNKADNQCWRKATQSQLVHQTPYHLLRQVCYTAVLPVQVTNSVNTEQTRKFQRRYCSHLSTPDIYHSTNQCAQKHDYHYSAHHHRSHSKIPIQHHINESSHSPARLGRDTRLLELHGKLCQLIGIKLNPKVGSRSRSRMTLKRGNGGRITTKCVHANERTPASRAIVLEHRS